MIALSEPTHDPKRTKNAWCGPAVISILSGMSCEEAAYRIRVNTGRKSVKGTDDGEVLKVLESVGLSCTKRRANQRGECSWNERHPTLKQWLKTYQDRSKCYLVAAGHHWIVIQKANIFDNQEKVATTLSSKHLRKRVDVWYEVSESEDRKLNPAKYRRMVEDSVEKKIKKPVDQELKRLRQIAKAFGVKLSRLLNLRELNKYGDTMLDFPDGFEYAGCTCINVFSKRDAIEHLEDCLPIDDETEKPNLKPRKKNKMTTKKKTAKKKPVKAQAGSLKDMANEKLQPLADYCAETHGGVSKMTKRFNEITGEKVTTQYAGRWVHKDPEKRIEPKLSAGLVLMRIAEEIGKGEL